MDLTHRQGGSWLLIAGGALSAWLLNGLCLAVLQACFPDYRYLYSQPPLDFPEGSLLASLCIGLCLSFLPVLGAYFLQKLAAIEGSPRRAGERRRMLAAPTRLLCCACVLGLAGLLGLGPDVDGTGPLYLSVICWGSCVVFLVGIAAGSLMLCQRMCALSRARAALSRRRSVRKAAVDRTPRSHPRLVAGMIAQVALASWLFGGVRFFVGTQLFLLGEPRMWFLGMFCASLLLLGLVCAAGGLYLASLLLLAQRLLGRIETATCALGDALQQPQDPAATEALQLSGRILSLFALVAGVALLLSPGLWLAIGAEGGPGRLNEAVEQAATYGALPLVSGLALLSLAHYVRGQWRCFTVQAREIENRLAGLELYQQLAA